MITSQRIRRDFPALADKAYLNTAAEGIPPPPVGAALQAYWQDKQLGMDGRNAHFQVVAECREVAARMIGFSAAEVEFCSCSAEAYNLLSTALSLGENDEVVINDLDFPSGATPWLVPRVPPKIRLWKSEDGQLEAANLRRLLGRRTRLVQLSLVSFYNGHRVDLPEVARCVRKYSPQAVLAVDVTQALGRCVLNCDAADIVVSSTHKWSLGIHGGCIVGVRAASAARLTARAGGWYNLEEPFAENRFARAKPKPGAASYAVGMPSFAPIYALNAGLRYLETIGIGAIARYADPLVRQAQDGLLELGLRPLVLHKPRRNSGIIAFRHPAAEVLHRRLHAEGIHVMHHAGRLRIAIHGYNTTGDIARFLHSLKKALHRTATGGI